MTTQAAPPVTLPALDSAPDALARHPRGTTVVDATILLPAFNEERGLMVVLDRLLPLIDERHEVVVVDDGSTDRSALVAELRGCRVVRHHQNMGKAQAVRSGVAAAIGRKVIVMDADDTYPVEAVAPMLEMLDECDVVIGARLTGREYLSPLNRIGNLGLRWLIQRVSGFTGSDPLTGLYGAWRSHLERMGLESTGFGIETEIAIKSARMGMKLVELPIEYRPRVGESKLSPWADGWLILKTIWRLGRATSPRVAAVPEDIA